MSAPISLQEASEFIWREAELLDQLAYKQWLPLWTDTGTYVVPIQRDDGDPETRLNVLYDHKELREARVKRLLSGFSMSAAPPARTVRTVSRFVVKDASANSTTLRCAQHLIEYKYNRFRFLPADVTYRLVRQGDELKIELKSVLLINSDDDLFGIGYLL